MKKSIFVNARRTCQRVGVIAFCGAASGYAADPLSYNTGSLGTAGDGTHINSPLLDQPGALTVYNDYSVAYSGGSRTTVPALAALNPPAGSPFTIEFWAKPTGSDGERRRRRADREPDDHRQSNGLGVFPTCPDGGLEFPDV